MVGNYIRSSCCDACALRLNDVVKGRNLSIYKSGIYISYVGVVKALVKVQRGWEIGGNREIEFVSPIEV